MAMQTPKSLIRKLVRCQEILGYHFKDLSLLQQSLTLGETNKSLATAGDTYVQAALVDRWFSLAKPTSDDFNTIRTEALCNYNLAQVGFRRGLDMCTLPDRCEVPRQMATTVEAILGAVHRDALFKEGRRKAVNWTEFENVISRLGINHRLIASAADLRWSLRPVRTSRKILPRFFSRGHHFDLAKMLAGMTSKLPSISLTKAEACSSSGRAPSDDPHQKIEVNDKVSSGVWARLTSNDGPMTVPGVSPVEKASILKHARHTETWRNVEARPSRPPRRSYDSRYKSKGKTEKAA